MEMEMADERIWRIVLSYVWNGNHGREARWRCLCERKCPISAFTCQSLKEY
jgi:hypothetical protein